MQSWCTCGCRGVAGSAIGCKVTGGVNVSLGVSFRGVHVVCMYGCRTVTECSIGCKCECAGVAEGVRMSVRC